MNELQKPTNEPVPNFSEVAVLVRNEKNIVSVTILMEFRRNLCLLNKICLF